MGDGCVVMVCNGDIVFLCIGGNGFVIVWCVFICFCFVVFDEFGYLLVGEVVFVLVIVDVGF